MSIENARLVGQGTTGNRIAIRYISETGICYTCITCRQEHTLPIDKVDREKEWFSFPCGTSTCDGMHTRMVNLRKFLTSSGGRIARG